MSEEKERRARTVRELGGEIWSVLRDRISEEKANYETKIEIVDVVMSVLASHVGEVIDNDSEMPVSPIVPS